MSTLLDRNARRFIFVFVVLITAIVSGACAAPAPPRVEPYSALVSEELQVYILPPNASEQTIKMTLTEILSDPMAEGSQTESIGEMASIKENYVNKQSLTTNGALLRPVSLEINDQELVEGILPHLIGRVGVSCVQSSEQAFWILDKTAIRSLVEDLDPNSELGQSVASCGAECQDCGCIGPMGGTCSASLLDINPLLDAATE